MQDSVGLNDYRESRKSLTLFVKMIFRLTQPLIRLGLRRATFPPRGRLFIGNTTTPHSSLNNPSPLTGADIHKIFGKICESFL